MRKPIIDIIIPAFNEEDSIAQVVADIPKSWARHILVCNNASTDRTKEVAQGAGATVLDEPNPGYGNACLKGLAFLKALPPEQQPEIVVFLDGDYSDYPEQLPELVAPIMHGQADLVIGSRAQGEREKGAMQPQQVFGNWLATTLIRWLYGYRFTDLGPFRAIRWKALQRLGMKDRNYGWTVEMQVRAAQEKLVCTEVPVRYRKRIGVSKVSGTLKGTIMAGYKILYTIFKLL